MTRGEIRYRERARQINDYSCLRYGKITPTDIDGLLDFGNKLFVFIEVKYKRKAMDRGQELALERVCDGLFYAGLASYVIECSHAVANPSIDVDVAECVVIRYRFKRQWRTPKKAISVRAAIDKLRGIHL